MSILDDLRGLRLRASAYVPRGVAMPCDAQWRFCRHADARGYAMHPDDILALGVGLALEAFACWVRQARFDERVSPGGGIACPCVRGSDAVPDAACELCAGAGVYDPRVAFAGVFAALEERFGRGDPPS